MHRICPPDWGLLSLAFCSGGILGVLACAVINEIGQRKPPS